MKKLISISTAIIILTVVSTTSAHAGRKTVERIMFGTGAAVLGAAILHGIHNIPEPRHISNHPWRDHQHYDRHRYEHQKKHHRKHHRKHYNKRPRGHWEIEKIWIGPVYGTRWNPGHYNRRGKWKNGRHEKIIVTRGHWQQEKVWVRH